mmetsp:Transcript_24174/g.30411  ORF Transcript_24174/g.30411 Transcript_24174/m.30411 type:complete len:83 (+) Transcript_24174:131-379(+)
MSSGFGIKGGVGRCYPFFAEYKECLQKERSLAGTLCNVLREDYFECLHHKKEYAMVKKIVDQHALNEKTAAGGGDHGHGGGH